MNWIAGNCQFSAMTGEKPEGVENMLASLVTTDPSDIPPMDSPLVIAVSTWVGAVCARVFHALVIDEYMEMWIASKDRPVRCLVAEPRMGGILRIDVSRGQQNAIVIEGSCTNFDKDRSVTYTLTSNQSSGQNHYLDFRLSSEQQGTRVSLLHRSQGIQEQEAHFQSAWEAAFVRLAALFASSHGVESTKDGKMLSPERSTR